MNTDLIAMQSQQISWLPKLDNLVTASGSPGFTFETCFCKVIIIGASISDNFVPFVKTNALETLTYKVEQCRTIFRERDEVLGLKSCLIRRDVSGSPGGHAVYQAYGIFQKTLMSTV
jgi:hypothetical protein